MYSRLNVIVNEINALGVKNITNLNINRKILQSLWMPDYDLVKAIIYEKKLEKGATVTRYKCHGEGHKFYKCPQFVKKMDKGAKKKLNPTIKSSRIYT
jgi:hypothetical protein